MIFLAKENKQDSKQQISTHTHTNKTQKQQNKQTKHKRKNHQQQQHDTSLPQASIVFHLSRY